MKKKLNNTYIGASRVVIDIAKSFDSENSGNGIRAHDKNGKNSTNYKISSKKYDDYKKIVEQGYKKSWDDVLIPKNNEKNLDKDEENLYTKSKK